MKLFLIVVLLSVVCEGCFALDTKNDNNVKKEQKNEKNIPYQLELLNEIQRIKSKQALKMLVKINPSDPAKLSKIDKDGIIVKSGDILIQVQSDGNMVVDWEGMSEESKNMLRSYLKGEELIP